MVPAQPNFVSSNKRIIHINPNFLLGQQSKLPAIHMNPQFLQQNLPIEQEKFQNIQSEMQYNTIAADLKPQTQKVFHGPILVNNDQTVIFHQTIEHGVPPIIQNRKIISKTRSKIVREPAAKTINCLPFPKSVGTAMQPLQPLIKLSKLKLVRRMEDLRNAIVIDPSNVAKKKETVKAAKIISTQGKYKLDKRLLNTTILKTKYKYIKQSSVQYCSLRNNKHPPLKRNEVITSSTPSKRKSLSSNKSLKLCMINGVLYKSTKNKLQRNDIKTLHLSKKIVNSCSSSCRSNAGVNANAVDRITKPITKKQHTLFIRGTKYIMDAKGVKLTRIPNSNNITSVALKNMSSKTRQRTRIDIGGLTYVASKTQNVFVRTRNHLAMAHLTTARQRSLQLLTRNFVKSNIPCGIFQRIGKCLTFERGKCSKVHDKRQVTICPRFLRGDCRKSNCLLSHNVSLAKMPVCKFFLQGICVRDDCPYLHKKLSKKTEICADFLRGYCLLAEKCNKRHEFLCPEYERKGKCDKTNCVHCKNKLWQENTFKKMTAAIATAAQKKQITQKIQGNDDVIAENMQNSDKAIEIDVNEKEDAIYMRYFSETVVEKPQHKEECTKTTEDENDETNDNQFIDETLNSTKSIVQTVFARRPKVGELPAFIPLS